MPYNDAQMTPVQRAVKVLRALRRGERLTAKEIARLVDYGDKTSPYALMLNLERYDPDIICDLIPDPAGTLKKVQQWRIDGDDNV